MKSVGFLNNFFFKIKSNAWVAECETLSCYKVKIEGNPPQNGLVVLFRRLFCFVLFQRSHGDNIKWPSAAAICRVHENHLSMPSDVNSFSLQSDIYESFFLVFMKVFMLFMKVVMLWHESVESFLHMGYYDYQVA